MKLQKHQEETSAQLRQTDAQLRQTDVQIRQMALQTDEQMRQMAAKADARSAEIDAQFAEIGKHIDELAQTVKDEQKNTSGVGNSLGDLMEGLFAANICPKFNVFGHTFTKASNDAKYYRDGKLFCEVDVFLENGDYVMAIEVKTRCEMRDINKHIERLEKLRQYMSERKDERKILGAIASGKMEQRLIEATENHGLYVIVPNGNGSEILETPGNFTEQVW
jgi:Holliday junction resolvase